MALYPFQCAACGKEQDHFIPMADYRAGIIPQCPEFIERDARTCLGKLERLVVNVWETGTENTFKPRWDHALSLGKDPVLLNSRADWKRLMDRHGIRPKERGDQEAHERELKQKKAKSDADTKKLVSKIADAAFDKAVAQRPA